ncbi:hypothetical protein Tco_0955353 [Tanacetum coccineum]|uniref:Uncharacterized protein n=1 Tax=Tanacetum coccineum TaxID=301880 RepID=A0ABQ5E6Z7_9ASTR
MVRNGISFYSIDNNDKNLSEIQLDHERVDRFVMVVVKVVHEKVVKKIEDGHVEEMEKLRWWFEQDIDDEGEENEEDEDGGEGAGEEDPEIVKRAGKRVGVFCICFGDTGVKGECAISNFNHGSTFYKISMLHVPPENKEFEGEIIPCSDFRLGTSQPCG